MNTRRKWLIGGLVGLWLALYLVGAYVQARDRNTFMWGVDQRAYATYARDLARNDYQFPGDRNRMPLYPMLQSLHYREGMSLWRFFNEGQAINIGLSVVFLVGLYAILRKRLPPLLLLNFLLITSFTVFMFKAGYFQTELLFYFLFFCTYLMLGDLLVKPDPLLAMVAGGTLALAHLSKASALPALALFMGLMGAKNILTPNPSPLSSEGRKDFIRKWLTLALVPLIFLIILYPYLRYSHQVYGHYFYNVNSTFYFWASSSHEAEYVEAHGDRLGWPDLPDDEIPSMRRYIREHDVLDMAERLQIGLQRSFVSHTTLDYGYLKFLALFTLASLLAALFNWRGLWQLLNRQTIWQVIFRAGFLGGYFASYVWYALINSGQRFMLSIFLPYLFTLAAFLSLPLFRTQKIRLWAREIEWVRAFNYGILLLMLVDIALIFVGGRISHVYGGR